VGESERGQLTEVLDVPRLRGDFPILAERVNGHPLVYLDSAATSQKPEVVIDAISNYYRSANANVHRGVHALGERATEVYEGARESIAEFINADPRGVVFVRNTTEGLNLVAQAYARPRFGPSDRIVATVMEHHANLVPWQQVRDQTGCQLEFISITDQGRLDEESSRRPPGCWQSPTSATSWARSTRSGNWSSGLTGRGSWSASTAPRPSPTWQSTWRSWAPTSMPSPDTRCAGRPG